MLSLKYISEPLARLLGTTPATLYERQRVLVNAGVLEAKRGRGPGSGVRATPLAIARLLVATVGSPNLGEAESRTRAIGKARPKNGTCSITGQPTFENALAEILSDPDLAAKVFGMTISQSAAEASLTMNPLAGTTRFSNPGQPAKPGPDVRVYFNRTKFQQLARAVRGWLDLERADALPPQEDTPETKLASKPRGRPRSAGRSR